MHAFDPSQHPPKPAIEFPKGIYREIQAIAVIDGDLDELARQTKAGHLIFRT
jgi:hypothetical protein